ncbi:chromosome segregation protein SMC [Alphaproteobacteria bacterium]|nr:chromosome segregation protein SMC [Alphaproteobacteria bacterium]
MKFKSIRISGFKSFLESTEIPIDNGLTGIVGPNGCGKSNIVEAMKWVMGENSARQMRGDGMDDIIFSGTNERPARNFAEVSIKLDNTEKKAPSNFNQFDEIEISRKIEREKGSIYRVNGKQVRSRDIQLIFADNGTGARSSGIVSQGRISQIIDSSPENRRVILEEAANIKGLHSRRHEAELKLNGATDNLSRLLDIEQTYNEQLVELEKQARKASRYRSVGERLRKAESTLFIKLLNSSETDLKNFKNELEIATDRVNQAQLDVSKNTKSKLVAFDKIPELKKIEAEKAAFLQSLNINKIRLEEEKSSANKTLDNIFNQISQIEIDIEREEEIKEDSKKSLLNLEDEEKKLKTESKAFEGKIDQAISLVKELKKKSDEADQDLSSINSKIYSINSNKENIEKRITDLKEKIKKSEFQIPQFNILEEEKSFKENKAKIIKGRKLLEEKNKLLLTKKNEYEAIKKILNDLNKAKTEADYKVNITKAELNSLSSLLGHDTSSKETLENSIDSFASLEKSIGSILGETLLAPVLSNLDTPKNTPFWRKNLKGIIETKLPDGVKPIIKNIKNNSILDLALLGVGIVDNEKIAFKLQDKLSFGQALTTVEGGLWRWDGFVQPPQVQNSYSERLQNIAKLRSLEKEIPNLENRQKSIQSKIDKNELYINVIEKNILELESQIYDLIEANNNLNLLNTKIESKIGSSKILVKEHQNIIDLSNKELNLLNKELINSSNLPLLLTEELKIRNIADQCRNSLTDAMAAEQQVRNHESYQSRNLLQIKNQKNNWKKREDEAIARLLTLQNRQKSLSEEKQKLMNLPDNFKKREDELNLEINKALQLRNKAADNLVEAETNLNELEKLEKLSEQNMSSLREEMIKIEAKLNLSKSQVKNIEERVWEKLRINTDQLYEIANLDKNDEIDISIDALEKTVHRLINERDSIGAVNLRAEEEMKEMRDKIKTMSDERIDLEQAIDKLKTGIFELNKEGRQRLKESFEEVNKNFKNLFQKLFGGGNAELKLIGNEDPLHAGLEVLASPPGKKMQLLSLLSGGEQALTAISLIFSVFLCNPAPICILDEVDAPLDDSNVGRFCNLLEKIVEETDTYFMVVTHHRLTMAKMDRLFGVTMEQKGISRLVAVNLEQANRIKKIA